MRDYDNFSNERIEHLKMIQDVIHRLGTATFLAKRWSFAFTAVLLSFSLQQEIYELALVSAFSSLAFWVLDHDFLRSERLFRALYEHVRTSEDPDPFFMNAPSKAFIDTLKQKGSYGTASRWNVFCSRTLSITYGFQVVVALVVVTIIV